MGRSRLGFTFLFALTVTGASAQTLSPRAADGASPRTYVLNQRLAQVLVNQSSATCPAAFSVERRGTGDVVQIGDDRARRGGQGVRVLLSQPTRLIAAAEVVVFANSTRPRLLPVGRDAGAADISRTFHLTGKDGVNGSDLWVEGAGSVLSADVISITYVDGSTWEAPQSRACHAVPSGYLLVNANGR